MPDFMNHDMFDGGALKVPHNSKVSQYCPLNYPGGKCRHAPFSRGWVRKLGDISTLVEPFAGGANIGLAAALEGWVNQVVLVELDEDVANFWQTITSGEGDWVAERVRDFNMTHDNADRVLERRDESKRKRAFARLVENRVSFNGLTNRNGRCSNASNNWWPEALASRIEQIHHARHAFQVIHGDGLKAMAQRVEQEGVAFFVDPPYPEDGTKLYKHSDVDHDRVFQLCAEAGPRALLAYNDTGIVRDLVDKYDMESRELVAENGRHNDAGELLISDDMGWL
jgi:DNA adenine methylase